MSTMGERIASARISRNLTQKELSTLVNISESTLARFEKGIREPRSSTIIAIAQVLNVSCDYLMGLTDVLEPYTLLGSDEIKNDIWKIFESAEKLLNQDEMLLYGKPISKEEVDSFFNLMKAGIDMIKVKR